LQIKEIWFVKHGDLIKTLTVNDLKIKYQNTSLGLAWSLLSPLLLLLVLYFVFYNLRQHDVNFVQYLLVGILTWRFFTAATSSSLPVIKRNVGVLSNIVLPSEIFVFIKNLSALISFTLEFIILIPLVALLTGAISPYAILFPAVHLLFFLIAFGISLILASLYPYFRDLAEIWPVLMQLGFFLCPIIYPLSIIPESFQKIYLMNPVTQVMIIYRDLILGGTLPSLASICYVLIFGIGTVIAGHFLFSKLEKRFVEVI
jgi:lipopolysaccharide transport system permease protein